ncbi:MAG: DUF2461 domain-containing protein [Bacteroidia bacterium]
MKNVFDFLNKLNANNNREWFTQHKTDFDAVKKEFKSFSDNLAELMLKHDNVDPKPHIYRIYRDVRFSKDKTPYKTHLAGSLKRLTPMLRGGYYYHIQPGGSFLGGGFWQPSKDDLQLIRAQIQQDSEPLRQVINSNVFKSYFEKLDGDKLKTAPKGFDKEDPNIDLLRHKSFIVSKTFTDDEVLANDFYEKLNEGFKNMRPFFNVMSDYLTTNLNGESLL